MAYGRQGKALQINIIQTPSTFISLITVTATPSVAVELRCLSVSHTPVKLTLLSSKGNMRDKVENCLPCVDISITTSQKACLPLGGQAATGHDYMVCPLVTMLTPNRII